MDVKNPLEKGFAHIFIVLFLVLIALVTTGYFVYKSEQKGFPSQIPAPSTVDTSDWEVYKNEKYGFEFMYPPNFSYHDANNLQPLSSSSQIIGSLNNDLERINEFTITASSGGISLNEYIESRKLCKTSSSCKPVVSGSIPGSLQIVTNEGRYSSVFTFVKKGNIIFGFSHQSSEADEQFLEEYNQILSTFKFTVPKDLSIDWNKYSNVDSWLSFNSDYKAIPKRNFSFFYPPVFTLKNNDSGSVILKTTDYIYVSMEQILSFNTLYGESTDQKLHTLYENSNYSPLKTNNYTKILYEDNLIVYKIDVKGEAGCSLVDVFDAVNWECYVVSTEDYGIAISVLSPVQNTVIIDLIKSVQFKQL